MNAHRISDLRRLSICQLLALYEAHAAANEGYRAIQAQPRSEGDVYDLIDAFGDDCLDGMKQIAEHVIERSPNSASEREARGEILVQWNLACGDWRSLVAAARENFEQPIPLQA